MAINIPTINEKFLDNNGQVNSTWYNYLRTGGASNIGDVLPNFFIVSGAYIQASNYWLNLSVDNGWLSGDTYQGAYADLLKLSDASGVNIRFTTSDARDTEIATYGESGAFVLDTNNKRFKIPMVTKTIGNLSTLADIGTVFGNSAATGSAIYAGVKFPYFMKVGNKTLEASTVDLKKEAEDQKAAIASLGQAQLEAISSAGNTQIALIESSGTAQINAITSAGTIQYDAITLNGTTWKNDIIATGTLWNNTVISTGNAQVILVEDAGTTQIGLIETAGTTQIGLVNDAGAAQVGLVEGEGDTQVARVISEGTSYVTAAQNWAIKTDGPVSGSDYSSKYNANLAYTYAQSVNPDNIVHIAGTETITGLKTFSSSPIVPSPTTDYQAATKKYVDDNAGGSGLPLFAPLYLDYTPSDASYVFSDGSSYVSGTVYTTAYAHLLDEYNLATDTTETVGGVTVTYRRAADGHKIIDVASIANYTAVLAATGTAWYYVLDQTNTRFMLPFTNWFIQGGATTYGSMAAYQAAGLPNLVGAFTCAGFTYGFVGLGKTGVFTPTDGSANVFGSNNGAATYTAGNGNAALVFNASNSNPIYGSSTTVQPKSNKLGLYFVCGNTVVNEYLIDAAGLASKDLDNLSYVGYSLTYKGSTISGTKNLNNYTTSGKFSFEAGGTYSNVPIAGYAAGPFWLEVYKEPSTNYLYQVLTNRAGTTKYTRYYNYATTTWTAWLMQSWAGKPDPSTYYAIGYGYIAPCNGWAYCYAQAPNTSAILTLNGVTIWVEGAGASYTERTGFIPVAKGTTIGGSGLYSLYFIKDCGEI